jgi:hypothetical protein
MCPSISEILLVADALVRETVERELVIGFPAVGVAGRVERGLASGGAAPADSLAVAKYRIAPAPSRFMQPRRTRWSGGAKTRAGAWVTTIGRIRAFRLIASPIAWGLRLRGLSGNDVSSQTTIQADRSRVRPHNKNPRPNCKDGASLPSPRRNKPNTVRSNARFESLTR